MSNRGPAPAPRRPRAGRQGFDPSPPQVAHHAAAASLEPEFREIFREIWVGGNFAKLSRNLGALFRGRPSLVISRKFRVSLPVPLIK